MMCINCSRENTDVNEDGLCPRCESAKQIKSEKIVIPQYFREEKEVMDEIKKCGIDDPNEEKLWRELRKIRAMKQPAFR